MSNVKTAAVSAPDVAYRWLRQTISALPWDEELFLNENAVAEASGTSRTPVREALLRMEAAGLVRRVPHKGAFIPALSEKDIAVMMEARQVIEEWAVRKVTSDGRDTTALDDLLAQQAQALADPLLFIECDVHFHRHIIELADNPVLQHVYDSQRFKQLRMGVKAVVDSAGRSDHVLLEHQAIVRAMRTGDPDAALGAVRDHLNSTLTALQAPGRRR